MKTILLADAGATKTDWVLAQDKTILSRVNTQGISPIHQDADTILRILKQELLPHLEGGIPNEVFFYGAGCSDVKCAYVAQLIRQVFENALVEVHSDLLGAARALCGHDAGIACILGTGANSCYYDGTRILQNTPPLGYILGDEGSGAVMGKNFVANVLKGIFPKEIQDAFYNETQTTYPEIIERVYRQPLANRYLASLSGVVKAHREHPAVHAFLIDHFRKFIQRNVRIYGQAELPLHFVGGIAFSFRQELENAAQLEGMVVGKTERSPMDGLIAYHKD